MTLTWHTGWGGRSASPTDGSPSTCRAGDVVLGYAWRDLARNPRRTLAAMVGIILGIGLFSGVLFFSDASGATLTKRAIAPLALDMQSVLTTPLGRGLRFDERLVGPSRLERRQQVRLVITVENEGAVPANDVVIRDEPPPPLTYAPGTLTVNGRRVADIGGRARWPTVRRARVSTSEPCHRQRPSPSSTRRAPTSRLPRSRRCPSRAGSPAGSRSFRRPRTPAPMTLEHLQDEIRRIPGVAPPTA